MVRTNYLLQMICPSYTIINQMESGSGTQAYYRRLGLLALQGLKMTVQKKWISNNSGINMILDGDWLYYRDQGIYRVRTDGAGIEKLTEDEPSQFNILNGWIYYFEPLLHIAKNCMGGIIIKKHLILLIVSILIMMVLAAGCDKAGQVSQNNSESMQNNSQDINEKDASQQTQQFIKRPHIILPLGIHIGKEMGGLGKV